MKNFLLPSINSLIKEGDIEHWLKKANQWIKECPEIENGIEIPCEKISRAKYQIELPKMRKQKY